MCISFSIYYLSEINSESGFFILRFAVTQSLTLNHLSLVHIIKGYISNCTYIYMMSSILHVLAKAMRYHVKMVRSNANRFCSIQRKSIFRHGLLYRGYYTNRIVKPLSIISRRAIVNIPNRNHNSNAYPNPNPNPNPNLTDKHRMEFMVKINNLYHHYKKTGITDIPDDDKLSECDKCKLVIEKYLHPFTLTILPNHPNIKCCVAIQDEEQLLLSISKLTGVSQLDLRQYFKDLASTKIDEKDVLTHQNSFQYDGKVHYCRVSAIAHDICIYIGPCHINHHFDSNLDISISNVNNDSYTRL